MRPDLVVVPGQHRADGQVIKTASCRKFVELRQQCVGPVVVHEQRALRRALLSRRVVCVLVTLPGDVVEPLRIEIGADDFPVEPRVFETHLAMHGSRNDLGHAARTRELDQANSVASLGDEFAHFLAATMHEVEIVGIEPAVDQQADELLEHDRDLGVDLDEWAITHEQRAHGLQCRDLYREIEWRHDHDRSEWPPIAARFLPRMIAGVGETACQEAHAVTREILEKDARYRNLAEALRPALRHDALGQFREVFLHFGCGHERRRTRAHAAEVHVAVVVF